jgi:hypothetical protein
VFVQPLCSKDKPLLTSVASGTFSNKARHWTNIVIKRALSDSGLMWRSSLISYKRCTPQLLHFLHYVILYNSELKWWIQYFHTSSLFSGFSVANVSSIIWFPLKFHAQRLAKLSQCLQTIVKQQTRKKDKLDYNISILDAVVLWVRLNSPPGDSGSGIFSTLKMLWSENEWKKWEITNETTNAVMFILHKLRIDPSFTDSTHCTTQHTFAISFWWKRAYIANTVNFSITAVMAAMERFHHAGVRTSVTTLMIKVYLWEPKISAA